MRLTFDDYVLDAARRELRRGSDLVAIEPQVFDLLAYLVQNPDRVVTRDELLQAVWDGRIVSESAIANRINAARRAIGDSGDAQHLIRTVPRKGFRFVGAVKERTAMRRRRRMSAAELSAAVGAPLSWSARRRRWARLFFPVCFGREPARRYQRRRHSLPSSIFRDCRLACRRSGIWTSNNRERGPSCNGSPAKGTSPRGRTRGRSSPRNWLRR